MESLVILKVTSLEAILSLLKNANALISGSHVAGYWSILAVTHINIVMIRYDFNHCLQTGQLKVGSLKSSGS